MTGLCKMVCAENNIYLSLIKQVVSRSHLKQCRKIIFKLKGLFIEILNINAVRYR